MVDEDLDRLLVVVVVGSLVTSSHFQHRQDTVSVGRPLLSLSCSLGDVLPDRQVTDDTSRTHLCTEELQDNDDEAEGKITQTLAKQGHTHGVS